MRPQWAGRTVVIGTAVVAGATHRLAKPIDVRLLRQMAEEILA
jgi:hypothetical protein